MAEIGIIRWNGDASSEMTDTVARERQVRILHGGYAFMTYCSPQDYADLGIGHVFSEGMPTRGVPAVSIEHGEGCDTILVGGAPGHRVRASATATIPLAHLDVQGMARHITGASPLFEKTGAFHYAFIFDAVGTAIAGKGDIGRFNAIDKAVGHCIQNGIPLSDKVLFTTGRISGRTVSKAAALGIPAIISKAPPFYDSVLAAASAGITIIGFARNASFNVYASGRAQVV